MPWHTYCLVHVELVLSFGSSTSSLFCRDKRETETGFKRVVRPLEKLSKELQRMLEKMLEDPEEQEEMDFTGRNKNSSKDGIGGIWEIKTDAVEAES